MRLFTNKYLIPAWMPDGDDGAPGADQDATATDLAPVDVAAGGDGDPTAASPAPPDSPSPKPKGAQDPMVGVVTGLRAERRELLSENERIKRELAAAQALLNAPRNAGDPPAPQRTESTPVPDAEIDRRAEYKLFLRDVEAVRGRGNTQYGDEFNENVKALSAYGADNDQFVQDVFAADQTNAHVLLHTLAHDAQKAISLVGMDSKRRIAELTRMSIAAAAPVAINVVDPAPKAPAPKSTVSRAPAPAPALTPSASRVVDWRSDASSDEEFDKGFWENQKKRSVRR